MQVFLFPQTGKISLMCLKLSNFNVSFKKDCIFLKNLFALIFTSYYNLKSELEASINAAQLSFNMYDIDTNVYKVFQYVWYWYKCV